MVVQNVDYGLALGEGTDVRLCWYDDMTRTACLIHFALSLCSRNSSREMGDVSCSHKVRVVYGCFGLLILSNNIHCFYAAPVLYASTIGINVGTAIACFIIIGDSIPPILTNYVTLTVVS